jgi:hypothetical protein
MTQVLITVDTELSPKSHLEGLSYADNFERSIQGKTDRGDFGLAHKLSRLDAYDLTGVFFVEALHGLVWGVDALKRITDPILERGHDVQLHLHPEWLQFLKASPVEGRYGEDLKDYNYADQKRLIEIGVDLFEKAGVPRPIALRAGSFGADQNTLAAAKAAGLVYDSSYNQAIDPAMCRLVSEPALLHPIDMDGLIQLPVTVFIDYPGHHRPLHLCAVSSSELSWLMDQAIDGDWPLLNLVSHSFELVFRHEQRVNSVVSRRFDQLCYELDRRRHELKTCKVADLAKDRLLRRQRQQGVPRSSLLRTTTRLAEQVVGRFL